MLATTACIVATLAKIQVSCEDNLQYFPLSITFLACWPKVSSDIPYRMLAAIIALLDSFYNTSHTIILKSR